MIETNKQIRVAIIGSGISGLATSYYLLKNENVIVDLYEKESSIGGHSSTIEVDNEKVDIGFQVFNHKTYPNMLNMFRELKVEIVKTSMSFGVVDRQYDFEWGCNTFSGFIRSLLNYKFWIIIWNMMWFFRDANQYLTEKHLNNNNDTIGEFCNKHKYHSIFKKNYLIPFCSAVWSSGEKNCEDMNAYFVFQFMKNHSLLQFQNEQWYTIKNRSEEYVKKILDSNKAIGRFTVYKKEVVKIEKDQDKDQDQDKLRLYTKQEESTTNVILYDEIVLAVNCHQVYPLFVGSNLNSQDIERAYKNFTSTENKLVIHKDTSVMAKNRECWCSWNTELCNTGEKPVTTYWFQNLQHIKNKDDLFLTLNPNKRLSNVIQEYTMFHPKFSSVVEQYKEQIRGEKIQGVNNVWFTGAYLYNGFHEDGVVSALNVIQHIVKKHYVMTRSLSSLQQDIKYVKDRNMGIWRLVNMVNTVFCRIVVYVLKRLIKRGSINIHYNGSTYFINNDDDDDDEPIDVYVNSAYFFYLVIMKQDLGFAESYIKQYFETDKLYKLLELFVINKATDNAIYNVLPFTYIGRIFDLINHKLKFNSIENSRENIHKHYDLSNELYLRFLDKSMTYSSALFKDGLKPTIDNLYEAQQNKYNRITNKLGMNEKENPSILEIGCGWGGYAQSLINIFETKDFSYTGITISEEQYKYCQELFKSEKRINIVLIDYRLIQGQYDYVVSIEMIEAVGYEYFDSYFATINKRLKSNGRAMIQAITIPDNRYEKYKTDVDFIQKYVFPGGFLPSIGEMCKYGIKYNLVMTDINNFGIDYKHTLLLWLEKFKKNYEEIQTFGFDDYFYYLWEYYLVYCAVGFDNGMINLNQVMFTKYE